MIGYLSAVLLVLAVVAFLRRRRSWRRQSRRAVGDAEIRQILERGRIEVEEPLDLEEIRAEEEKFWDEERWE